MEMIEISAKVPAAFVERMTKVSEASGVTLGAFVAASFELRVAQHEGRDTLTDELLERAKKYV